MIVLIVVLWMISPIVILLLLNSKNDKYKFLKIQYDQEQQKNGNIIKRLLSLCDDGKISYKLYEYIIGKTDAYSDKTENLIAENNTEGTKITEVIEKSNDEPLQKEPTKSSSVYVESPAMASMRKIIEDKGTLPRIDSTVQASEIKIQTETKINNFSDVSVKTEKKRINPVSILAVIGAGLVIISSILFVSATWSEMSGITKIFFMLLADAVTYFVSEAARKKFKINRTAIVFFTISSAFLSIITVSAGYFGLFGNEFRLAGTHNFALFAASVIVLGIATAFGAKKYNNVIFAYTAMESFAVGSLLFIIDVNVNDGILSLLIAFLGIAVTFASEMVRKSKSNCLELYRKANKVFLISTVILLIIITLVSAQKGVESGISIIIISTLLLNRSFDGKNTSVGAYPFVILLTFGTFKMFEWQFIKTHYGILFIAVTVTAIFMAELGIFESKTKSVLRNMGCIVSVLSFIVSSVALFSDFNSVSIENIITFIILNVALVWVYHRTKSKWISRYQNILIVMVFAEISSYIFKYSKFNDIYLENRYLMVSALIAIAWIIYAKTKKMYTQFTDVIYTLSLLSIILMFEFSGSLFKHITVTLIYIAAVTLLAIRRSDAFGRFCRITYPLSLILPMITINRGFEIKYTETVNLLIVIYIVIIAVAGVLLGKFKFKCSQTVEFSRTFDAFTFSFGVICSLYLLVNNCKGILSILPVIITVYSFIRTYSERNAEKSKVRKSFCTVGLIYFVFSLYEIPMSVFGDSSKSLMFAAYTFMIEFAFLIYIRKKQILKIYTEQILLTEVVVSLLMTVVLYNFSEVKYIYWITLMLVFTSYILQEMLGINIAGIISIFVLYYLMKDALDDSNASHTAYILSFMAIETILALMGRLHYKKLKNDRFNIDLLTVSGLIAPFMIISCTFNYCAFWTSMIVYAAGYIKRTENKNHDRAIVTYMSALLAPVVWTQNLFEIPDNLSYEFKMLPLFVFSAVIAFLWKENEKSADTISFVITFIAVILLGFDAMLTEIASDAIIIILISLILLRYAFMRKRKKWLVLSVSTIVFITLYMMKPLMNRFNWWFFLLLVGIILIAIAAGNEYSKQNNATLFKSIKNKATVFLHEWKW